MKIEKICSKQDLIDNLKRAAKYSHLEHLRKLAEYVQQEIELDNLKEKITLESYELKIVNGAYQIIKIKNTYDSVKNEWQQETLEIVEEINLENIENIG